MLHFPGLMKILLAGLLLVGVGCGGSTLKVGNNDGSSVNDVGNADLGGGAIADGGLNLDALATPEVGQADAVSNPDAKVAIYSDDFAAATAGDQTTSNIFTTGYKTLPNDATSPMMAMPGTLVAGAGVSAVPGEITLTNAARFCIGALTPLTPTTTAPLYPLGVFDLTRPIQIKVTLSAASADTSGHFYVYIDNTTTLQGNSPLGIGSKTVQISTSAIRADITANGGQPVTYTITSGVVNTGVLDAMPVPTRTGSFLQLRTDKSTSGIDNTVTITAIEIDYAPVDAG